jgi:curli biogenesis system outer membrane secretion channel CsgG
VILRQSNHRKDRPKPFASGETMKNTNPLALILFALFFLNARGSLDSWAAEVRPGSGPNIEEAQAQPYDGPKARIAVADFEDKMSSTGQYRAEYGRGMADMLASALFNTNRYIVLERQKLSYVIAEQDLGASGRVKRQSAAAIGELEGAELLVVASVTGFDPGVSGGGGSLGVLGSLFGGRAGSVGSAIGSIAGGFRTAHIAIDVRLVDTNTGRVVAANSVEGSASDYSGSFGVANTPISGALGGFSKTPMEKAIRDVIQTSVSFVASKTPARYYRVGTVAAAQLPVPEPQAAAPVQMPQAQSGFAPPTAGFAPQPFSQGPQDVASLRQQLPAPPPAPLKTIATDKNPKLVAELTEVRKRGAVVSVVITVRNNGTTKERLDYQQAGTHLLDYSDGKKYDLVSGIHGRRSATLGPNEQVVIRAMFKAPPNSEAVAVVVDEIGTFEDVSLGQSPASAAPPTPAPQAGQASQSSLQPGSTQQPATFQQQPTFHQQAVPFQQAPGQQGTAPFQAGQHGAFPQQGFSGQAFNQPAGGMPAHNFPSQAGFPPQSSFGYPGSPGQGGMWSWPPQSSAWPVQPGPQEVVAPSDSTIQPITPGVPTGGSQPAWLKPDQSLQPALSR